MTNFELLCKKNLMSFFAPDKFKIKISIIIFIFLVTIYFIETYLFIDSINVKNIMS